MKRYINLLPSDLQREIRLEKLFVVLFNMFVWILLSIGIVALLYVAGEVYLKTQISSLKDQIALQRKAVSKEDNLKLKQQLARVNTDLANLVNLQEHHALWSEALIAFARLVPEDVSIDSFTASRKTGVVRITGFAKRRESVLALRENLLASPYFKDVNFPLSNLNRAADVNFYYTFRVNPEFLIEPEAP